MKTKIHPRYQEALYRCASCHHTWISGTTKIDGNKVEHNGRMMPSITLEICSSCHPFFTGKSNLIDTTGRVEKFNKRFAKTMADAKIPAAAAAKK